MSEGELKGVLLAKVTNSLGYYGGKLSKARVTALQYYQGEPFGNELDGRSQVVDRVVAEAVDGMMPALMKIFTSGEEVVKFEPGSKDVQPGMPPQAIEQMVRQAEKRGKQATDYVNWIWLVQNNGFQNVYTWFKDALLNRSSALKIWWDTETTTNKERYEGLTDDELAMLLQDAKEDEMDILSHESYPDPLAPPLAPPPPQQQMLPAPQPAQPDMQMMHGDDGRLAGASVGGKHFMFHRGPDGKLVGASEVPAPPTAEPPQAPPMGQLQLPPPGPPGQAMTPAGPPPAPGAAPGPPAGMPPQPSPGAAPMAMPQAPPPPPMLHDIELRRTNKTGRIRIIPIPGEEFLMDRRAVSLEETPFVCHRTKKVLSDLRAMGYPENKIKDLGEGDSADFNLERLERFRQEDELPYRTGNNYDPSMREIWLNECYLKVDYDGDGIAELRKITFAGESGNFAPGATVILDNEEVDDHPFAAITPVPMPHKFYGMSMADKTMDLQLIKSTIFRNFLDHTYNAVMPQLGVVDNQVNLDDLLTRRPGGIVRMKAPDAIFPIPPGEMPFDPIAVMSYLDSVREGRTGVKKFTASAGPDPLNNAYTETATGVDLVEDASQEQIELVARCFAEIGVKPAFRKIQKLVSMHQNKPKMIRLRGSYVTMDPREWDDEFDVTVTVGIGTGNRKQQLQLMTMLLQTDQQLITMQKGVQGPIVTAQNVYNKLAKIIEFGGLKSVEPFYTDPTANPMPPQPPQPDPHVQATQIKAQADQQTAQLQMQHDAQKMQLQMQQDQAKAQTDIQLDRERMAMEAQLKREETQQRVQADIQIAIANAQIQREVEFAKIQAQERQHASQMAFNTQQHQDNIGVKREGLSIKKQPPAPVQATNGKDHTPTELHLHMPTPAKTIRKKATFQRNKDTGDVEGINISDES